jgi:hypothetical protein
MTITYYVGVDLLGQPFYVTHYLPLSNDSNTNNLRIS